MSLFEQLQAAATDDERKVLLATASPQELLELQGALIHHQLLAESDAAVSRQQAAFDVFTASLAAAASDAERLALIKAAHADRARGPAWVAEWAWQRRASPEDWSRRYKDLIGAKL